MTVAGRRSVVPPDARNLEAGLLLIGLGAILLLISLFLEWYQPGVDAWEIFEVWDLVLAMLAVAALAAVASRMGFGPARPDGMIFGPALAALVIVLYAFFDPPPLTSAIDGDPGTGLWLALAATILMSAGAMLSFARVSVAFTRAPGVAAPAAADPARPYAGAPVADPAYVDPAAVADPARPRGRRFMRGPADPAEPAVPPTEPTRRM